MIHFSRKLATAICTYSKNVHQLSALDIYMSCVRCLRNKKAPMKVFFFEFWLIQSLYFYMNSIL